MRILARLLVAAAVVGALPLLAQEHKPNPAATGGVMVFRLLNQKAVQDELKLSETQVKQFRDAARKLRDLMVEEMEKGDRDKARALAKEHEKDLDKILKPDQANRLRQIDLQLRGAGAFTDAALVQEMKITPEQHKQLRALAEETARQINKLFEGDAATREELRKKMAEITVTANEKVLALLTGDQKTQWKEKTGVPFKGEIRRGQPARRP
jgi:hypothetical protein